jgi:hypothetical protein
LAIDFCVENYLCPGKEEAMKLNGRVLMRFEKINETN